MRRAPRTTPLDAAKGAEDRPQQHRAAGVSRETCRQSSTASATAPPAPPDELRKSVLETGILEPRPPARGDGPGRVGAIRRMAIGPNHSPPPHTPLHLNPATTATGGGRPMPGIAPLSDRAFQRPDPEIGRAAVASLVEVEAVPRSHGSRCESLNDEGLPPGAPVVPDQPGVNDRGAAPDTMFPGVGRNPSPISGSGRATEGEELGAGSPRHQ